MINKWIKCDCGTHAIQLIYDKEDKYLCMAFYQYGVWNNNLNLWDRLRWCWHLLSKGYPFADEVILNSKEINKLIKYLGGII